MLLRADGCWAYQLAVVIDDADQGVNQILRGADLLDSTPRQIYLQRLLGAREPQYLHIPVIANVAGVKLSKQTLAPALRAGNEAGQLWQALKLLWQSPSTELAGESLHEVWRWAQANWSVGYMPHTRSVSVSIEPGFQYEFLGTGK